MLEPRESDIPALFVFLVVLPVVTYILLGKWSEAAKRKERISLLAQLATEEAQRAEAMAAVGVIPVASPFKSVTHDCVASSLGNVINECAASYSKNVTHQCALCFRPATTRCSRCKSVRYCSGKCQIIHWRQGHKLECQQLETSSSSSSPKLASIEDSVHESVLTPEDMNSQFLRHKMKQSVLDKAALENRICPPAAGACTEVSMPDRKTMDKRVPRKSKKELLRRENGAMFDSFEETSGACSTSSNIIPSKESSIRHKLRNSNSKLSEGDFKGHNVNGSTSATDDLHTASRSSAQGNNKLRSQCENVSEFISNSGISSSLYSGKNGKSSREVDVACVLDGASLHCIGTTSNGETTQLHCPAETTTNKRSVKSKGASYPSGAKGSNSARTIMKSSREQLCLEMEGKGQMTELNTMRDTAPTHSQGSNGLTSMGIMKMMGLKKSKPSRQDASEVTRDRDEKMKMLFPYEEFVKFFHCEVCDLSPRGLLNCGNSCYANAVLQCLTFTKPLVIYLLQRSHSRACCVRNWCLMCELEQHLMMLGENGAPMSPSRILSHMRSNNYQIGDGSQEDAHEFLRLLVTSMQCICLERLGGERVVDPRLQETTFIQHTFGGRLRSKVKCLRCQHESERYENIMDLTLEILGWVESLEDALTQFTTPEDLDGENMYRCGRCAAYVQARKQLTIHEAPNILTIVLKRFQEGRYGKINKCISFPDMLDMIPYMTGTDDIPPLYILYAVVVHLDTLNASFSGHYVAYVKDLQGNWFRIDDAEVQSVPMYQVMSEGAYILFYMRSSPRPPRTFNGKPSRQPAPDSVWHYNSNTQRTARSRPSKSGSHFTAMGPSSAHRKETTADSTHHEFSDGIFRNSSRNVLPMVETYGEGMSMEFSDATSSDWSIFTSSDDASFTTESTRDSFSTVDYTDSGNNIDPISSIFNTFYPPQYSIHDPISCRMFSNSKGQTGFVSEEKGYDLDSHVSSQHLDRVYRAEYLKQDSLTEFTSNDCCNMFVKYDSNRRDGLARPSCNCEL